jgi:hypothetical protein
VSRAPTQTRVIARVISPCDARSRDALRTRWRDDDPGMTVVDPRAPAEVDCATRMANAQGVVIAVLRNEVAVLRHQVARQGDAAVVQAGPLAWR